MRGTDVEHDKAEQEVEQEEKAARPPIEPGRWARVGAVLAVAALAAAFATDLIIGHFVGLPEGQSVAKARVAEPSASPERAPRRRESTRVPAKSTYLDPILRRNIFDSTAVGSTAVEGGETGEDGRRTDLHLTLLGTVVAQPASGSSALIAAGDGRDAKALGYGIGDVLLEEATILRIEQRKVVLRRSDGSLEYLDMGGEGAKKESPRSTGGAVAGTEDSEGITQTGEFSWEVDESVISGALGNIDSLVSQVRAIPHKGPDGEIDGFRLSAIRRGSLLQKLGIKNGDVIHGVNGTPMTSATGAMGAFQSMQSERQFSFDVSRRNQKHTFEYSIR
ncbi:MAG: type II secretion system protein GspC [Pseudomonadota bacterium]